MKEKKKALIFGEIVWDDIVPGGGSGKPENIGGASFNAAVHCSRLGMDSVMVSALGKDALGERTYGFVRESGVDAAYVTRSELPTCLITVAFNEKGEPAYTIPPEVSWDEIVLSEEQLARIGQTAFDAVYFGTLHQRGEKSRKTLHKILARIPCAYIYCDVNLRPPFYNAEILDESLSAGNIVKMNDQEIGEILKLTLHREEPEMKEAMRLVLEHYHLKILLVTCGEKGVFFMTPEAAGHVPGIKVEVADTVGAGDAFSAGFLHALCQGKGVEESCWEGNRMGAFIASRKSSIPPYEKEELEAWMGR